MRRRSTRTAARTARAPRPRRLVPGQPTGGVICLHTGTPRGRGVFALRDFRKGELIEACPVVPMPARDFALIQRTAIYHYPYEWGDDPEKDSHALVLGLGGIYNHSYDPNARYVRDLRRGVMKYVALRAIRAGEEITINYLGYGPGNQEPVEFEMC